MPVPRCRTTPWGRRLRAAQHAGTHLTTKPALRWGGRLHTISALATGSGRLPTGRRPCLDRTFHETAAKSLARRHVLLYRLEQAAAPLHAASPPHRLWSSAPLESAAPKPAPSWAPRASRQRPWTAAPKHGQQTRCLPSGSPQLRLLPRERQVRLNALPGRHRPPGRTEPAAPDGLIAASPRSQRRGRRQRSCPLGNPGGSRPSAQLSSTKPAPVLSSEGVHSPVRRPVR